MSNKPQLLPRVAEGEPPRRGGIAKRSERKGEACPHSRAKHALKSPRDRRAHEKSGHRAETLAALWLQLKGYRILARRFKTPVGEIDLVARRGRTIAFVEVKGRRDRNTAAESIHATNQQRVVRAAQWWLSKHGQYIEQEVRFDVCLIAWYRWPHHITHAFAAVA